MYEYICWIIAIIVGAVITWQFMPHESFYDLVKFLVVGAVISSLINLAMVLFLIKTGIIEDN
ncbi:hypothetical protein SAMN05421813_11758 [Daejeonella rubra]|uniref:Uncharacterized protein n=1 Tax=Daejeonella rubra TaxID=990371 RepID=A0A1G9URG7_9SPHI|nr:hypothetical protein SAMN05421813_11758 [Daejeonella rubra]